MRKSFILLSLIFLIATSSWAQLSGVKTIPGTYASISAAIADLNTNGVGTGGVIFNIAAAYTETISATLSLTATGTASNPIVFQKSGAGANPLITAYTTGIATSDSTVQDGIWNFIGSDYVTIDGIDLYDPNTTNPATMEYGYGFFKQSDVNGCQNNTIKNCVVTLNRNNNITGASLAVDGSRAINMVNALVTAQKTVVIPSLASGTNSYNKFYSNTLQNCNIGIALIGYAGATPFTLCDFGNDIGGTSLLTGNNIINYGGATAATNPAAAVRTLAQYDLNVSYNTVNNNNGSGVNHTSTLRGIYLNTALSANATISYNTITLKYFGKTSQVSVIENVSGSTAASNTIKISNNTITNCINDSTTSGVWYGIYNNAATPANLIINNNTFSSNTTKATSGATYLIYNSGAVTTVDSICGNQLSFSNTGTAAYTGINYNLYNNGAANTCSVVINNNNYSNYNYNLTGTGSLYFLYSAGTPYNLNISNNIWTNLSLNHSGTEYLCYISSTINGVALNFTNNFIAGTLTRTAAPGTMYCFNNSGSTVIGTVVTVADNDFSNITATTSGTGTSYGINEASTSPAPYSLKSVHGNTISNFNFNSTGSMQGLFVGNCGPGITTTSSLIYNNTITALSNAGTLTGLNLGSTSSLTSRFQVYNNTVNNLFSSGASSAVTGATIASSGMGVDFYKHNIFAIKANGATGLANGILVTSGGINTNIYNNFVSDVKAPNNSNTTDGVRGISITSTSVNTNVNLYYNTVFIDTTSGGANFSSSAIYHTYSATSTTAALTMRNNIFVNNATPKGTGIAVAFRRSASTNLLNMTSDCNYNCFYTDTTLTNHFIYSNTTTNYKSIQAYKANVAEREIQSFSELPPFTNIAAKPYDLHLITTTPTQCESSGIKIAGITTDYDDDARFGSVTPPYTGSGISTDVGADEANFLQATDVIPPAITYTPLVNSAYPNSTLVATITDPGGVPTTASGKPVLYWKINVPGSWNSASATSLGNNQFSFTFGTGANVGDSILYYVVAQDNLGNSISNPSLGAGGFGINPPSAGTLPTAIYQYKQLPSLSGVYTIDSSMLTGGTNFKTFTDAVTALNNAGLTAPVTFNVAANQSWAMNCTGSPLAAIRIANTTTSATNTVTFQKSGTGANPVLNIKGTSGSADYGIYLDGCKYITFNAIDVVDSGSSATNWIEYGIYLKGYATYSCQYNTFKNSVINMERSIASYGVYTSSAATSYTSTNSYNKFYNNTIKEGRYGYYFSGVTAFRDTLNEVGNELSGISLVQSIGSPVVATAATGIYATYQDALKIFNTTIDTVITSTALVIGMDISNSTNLNIYGDTIKNLSKTGAAANDLYLINITGSLAGTNNVYNNMLINCTIPATSTSGNLNAMRLYTGVCNWNVYGNTAYNLVNYKGGLTGIYMGSGSGTSINIYNNKLYNFNCLAATGAIQMIYGDQISTTYNIYNNYVYDIKNAASTTIPAVQAISANSAGTYKIYYNTIYLDYISTNAANSSAALYVNSATPVIDLRNNIFVNKCDMTNGGRAVAFWYTGKLPYLNIASTTNNNLFYSGIPGTKNLIFCDSIAPSATTNYLQTLTDYKTVSGKDANSVTEDPPFISNVLPYNLHMQTTVPTITEGRGQVIAGFTTDFDGDTRNATTPDLGADEFSGTPVVNCAGTPPATSISGAASVCINTGTALTLTPLNTDLGITHQWAYSITAGGPYTKLGTLNSQLTGSISTITYYVDTIRCTNSGLYYVTPMKTITINQYPVSSASVSTSPICANATLSLLGTTDIGTSFNWTGPNGFTSTAQNPSISSATTAASGVYSFTSTANGCTSSIVTTTAVVNQTPSAITVTPSATSFCIGNIQQLSATGGIVTGAAILTENFNGGTNSWTRFNNSVGGVPDSATWKLRPDAYNNTNIGIFHSNDNSQFYLSNSYDEGTGTGINTETILQSPSFNTINFTSANLNFYQNYQRYATNYDTARVEVSSNGTTWTTLQAYTYTSGNQGSQTAFSNANIALTAPFLNQPTVYIRFKYNTHTGGYVWAIDNVSISGSKSLAPTWLPVTGLYSDAGASIPYVSGTATPTVFAKPDAGTANYNATVTTSPDNCSITSNTAVVNVAPPSVGGTATASATSVCFGTGTTINLTGYTGSIQWQSSLDGTTWSNIVGQTSSTLLTGNLTTPTYYQAVVTSGACAPATSTVAIVSSIDPISIGGHIAGGGVTICAGTNSTTLTLSGNTGNITKWQSSPNGTSWTDISNTTTSYTATNLTTTSLFRAVIQSGVCSIAYSDTATININPVTVPGTVTGGIAVCSGINTTLLTLGSYTGSIIKWQSSPNGTTWTDIANTANTYTATNLTATTQYRAVVQSGVCSVANSVSTTVSVDPLNVGGTLSSDTTYCSTTNNRLLTLTGNIGNIVRWENSTNGGTIWNPISNTINTYTATNITATTKYRVIVQSGSCPAANSSVVTLTVNTPPTATITSFTNPSICAAANGSATVNTASTYSWATAPVQTTQTATGLAAGTYYVTISNGVCSNSTSVTLSDPSAPTVSIGSTTTVTCSGSPVTFTGNGATTYEFFINGVSQGAPTTTNTLTTTTLVNGNVVTVRGVTAGCTGNSGGITMTVDPV
ncbi:MAG: hypothetical protein NTZ33_13760, partial [Bacteroidetes bacterium]|nr:hypothetical protein [Bacteroidota bacterium]